MFERKHFVRFVSIALGLLTAGAVIATGIMFAFSSGEEIFAQMISGKYSAFILLVQVLESVAITLAAAAFAIDILDTLISQIGGRDISSRDMVTLIRQLEGEAGGILIPTVTLYSALKVLEFAAQPTWPADPNGWVEPVAFSGLILLSLLIHRVLSHQENSQVGRADHPDPATHTHGAPSS